MACRLPFVKLPIIAIRRRAGLMRWRCHSVCLFVCRQRTLMAARAYRVGHSSCTDFFLLFLLLRGGWKLIINLHLPSRASMSGVSLSQTARGVLSASASRFPSFPVTLLKNKQARHQNNTSPAISTGSHCDVIGTLAFYNWIVTDVGANRCTSHRSTTINCTQLSTTISPLFVTEILKIASLSVRCRGNTINLVFKRLECAPSVCWGQRMCYLAGPAGGE